MAKNQNIDDDTRARAKAFVEKNNKGMDSEGFDSREYRSDPYSKMTKKERDARFGYPDDFPPAVVDDATKRIAKPKARVVSKKELEESGLSLRDFLNRERGLTRRKDKSEDKVEAAKKQLKLGEKVSAEEVDKAKKQLNLAKGGVVMARCGASVPPAQKRK
jgi:hypothetical protein